MNHLDFSDKPCQHLYKGPRGDVFALPCAACGHKVISYERMSFKAGQMVITDPICAQCGAPATIDVHPKESA